MGLSCDLCFFGGVFADLTAEVDGIVMGDDTAHALFGLLALDHVYYAFRCEVASVRISWALSRCGAAPRAMSGLPPPLPPASGARVWMSLPAM